MNNFRPTAVLLVDEKTIRLWFEKYQQSGKKRAEYGRGLVRELVEYLTELWDVRFRQGRGWNVIVASLCFCSRLSGFCK